MAFKNIVMALLLLGSLESFCAFRNSENGVDLVLVLLKSGKYAEAFLADKETASHMNTSLSLPYEVREGDLVMKLGTGNKRLRDRASLNYPCFILPYSLFREISQEDVLRLEVKKQYAEEPDFFNMSCRFNRIDLLVSIAFFYTKSGEIEKTKVLRQLAFEDQEMMQEIIKVSEIDLDIKRGFQYFAEKNKQN